jgi:hypothetical protein
MYNMTQLQSVDTIFKLVIYANDSTGGFVALAFLLSVFFITLMALKSYTFKNALLVSSTISFFISLLLVFAKLVNPIWCYIFLIVATFTAFAGSIFD